MNDFTFQNTTKVLFGRHQLEAFAAEVAAAGERTLLVYGGGSVKRTGVYSQVAGALHAAGVRTFDLAGVEPNPRHTAVNRGAAIVRENGIDSVLAIGGGSAIDCAAL
jgi:alcohol dehydrogenase YqhD (iron-dependent ADH family)